MNTYSIQTYERYSTRPDSLGYRLIKRAESLMDRFPKSAVTLLNSIDTSTFWERLITCLLVANLVIFSYQLYIY